MRYKTKIYEVQEAYEIRLPDMKKYQLTTGAKVSLTYIVEGKTLINDDRKSIVMFNRGRNVNGKPILAVSLEFDKMKVIQEFGHGKIV